MDPFTAAPHPSLMTEPNCVGQGGAEAREPCFATLCVLRRSRFIEQLGRQAFGDRVLGPFRMYEEPRSIVRSRTIERRVLGTICSRRQGQRKTRGGQSECGVEWHARGVPHVRQRGAIRRVALGRQRRGRTARPIKSPATASPEIARSRPAWPAACPCARARRAARRRWCSRPRRP